MTDTQAALAAVLLSQLAAAGLSFTIAWLWARHLYRKPTPPPPEAEGFRAWVERRATELPHEVVQEVTWNDYGEGGGDTYWDRDYRRAEYTPRYPGSELHTYLQANPGPLGAVWAPDTQTYLAPTAGASYDELRLYWEQRLVSAVAIVETRRAHQEERPWWEGLQPVATIRFVAPVTTPGSPWPRADQDGTQRAGMRCYRASCSHAPGERH